MLHVCHDLVAKSVIIADFCILFLLTRQRFHLSQRYLDIFFNFLDFHSISLNAQIENMHKNRWMETHSIMFLCSVAASF